MALSVIKSGPGYKGYGLYDSKKERFLLTGTSEEMFDWKHRIETREQNADNQAYFHTLRQEWIDLLVKGGNTEYEAELFLKQNMKFLYENETA